MKISVILAHPNDGSLNYAIAKTAVEQIKKNGHQVSFHDLYKEGFDPLLPSEEFPKDAVLPSVIEKHCQEISAADGIIVVHPNWWGQPPAILKGWIDRVIRPGIAYEFFESDSGEGIPNGMLKAEAAIVYNTSNTQIEREKNIFGDPLETIWKNCIFSLCGVTNFHRRMFGIVVTSTQSQREKWLEQVSDDMDTFFQQEDYMEIT